MSHRARAGDCARTRASAFFGGPSFDHVRPTFALDPGAQEGAHRRFVIHNQYACHRPIPLKRPPPDVAPTDGTPSRSNGDSVTEKPGTSDTSIVRMGAPLDRAASDTPAFSTVNLTLSCRSSTTNGVRTCAGVCAAHLSARSRMSRRSSAPQPAEEPTEDRPLRSRQRLQIETFRSGDHQVFIDARRLNLGAPEQCPVAQQVDQTRDAARVVMDHVAAPPA